MSLLASEYVQLCAHCGAMPVFGWSGFLNRDSPSVHPLMVASVAMPGRLLYVRHHVPISGPPRQTFMISSRRAATCQLASRVVKASIGTNTTEPGILIRGFTSGA